LPVYLTCTAVNLALTASARKDMAIVRFTKRYIATRKRPSGEREEDCDSVCRGLRLRHSPTGLKRFSAAIRKGGALKRYDLGPAQPELLDEARRRVEALKQAAEERLPAAFVVEQPKPPEITFAEMRDEYVRWCEQRDIRSWRPMKGDLHNPQLTQFEGRPAASITKAEIVKVLDRIGRSKGLYSAKNVLRRLRPMFKRAVGRGEVPINPCDGIPAPAPDKERTRVLTNAEIKAIYKATFQLPDPVGQMIRIILYTGQRLNEVRKLKRSEIVDSVWTIPDHRSKNGRPHILPLTKEVMAELRSLPDHGPDKFAFSIRCGRTARTLGKGERRKLQKLSGTAGWSYHDIRRTVRTKLAELGVPDEVAERVISHTPGKLMRTYNLHQYTKEKREALEKWAKHLASLVEEPKSPPLSKCGVGVFVPRTAMPIQAKTIRVKVPRTVAS